MLFKHCLTCKKKFYKPVVESKKAWEFRHKYCSRKCSYDAKKNITGWAKGLTKTDPRIARWAKAGHLARKGKPSWNKGEKGLQVAEKNPNWLGIRV